MGIETIAFATLMGLNAASQMSAANKQAKAVVAEGNLAMQNKANDVRRKGAATQVSFLNSGLTLEGTPMGAIMGIYDTGLQDINQMGSIYNSKSKNIISSARSKVISDIATSAATAGMGSSLSGFAGDVSSGVGTMMSGQGFGLGYDVSNTVRNNPSIF
jgi:hypothetical protein